MPDLDLVEDVDLDENEVLFFGEKLRMADKIGRMPVLRYAKLASRGVDSSSPEGLVVMYDLLKACIHSEDWDRFNDLADENAADDIRLWELLGDITAKHTARPTLRSSDSSDGPSDIAPSSTSTPAGRAIARLDGRPDLQLAVVRAAEAQGMAV